MILFLVSETMLFAGLIGAYIVLRWSLQAAWPPAGAPNISLTRPPSFLNLVMLANTLILIASSLLLHRAGGVVKTRSTSGLFWMLTAMVAGGVFLGVQAWEWRHLQHEGLWFNTYGIYGSCFFVITGFHSFHILVGLLLMLWCFLKQLFTHCYTPEHTVSLDNVNLYWQFMTGAWIALYVILYVL